MLVVRQSTAILYQRSNHCITPAVSSFSSRFLHENGNNGNGLSGELQSSEIGDGRLTMFNSLSGKITPLPSASGKTKGLAWYTCGPTTYAPAHLGHARTYVWLDMIRRILEASHHHQERDTSVDGVARPSPPAPLFVMNITDVDDKILAAAEEQQISPLVLARKYEAEFWKDLEALNCLRPHVVTRVTDYVGSDIVPYVEQLLQKNMAYELPDGVYFDVRAYNERFENRTQYGKLAPSSVATPPHEFDPVPPCSCVSNGGDADKMGKDKVCGKKDSRDFVLWKKKSDEALSWPSPWGDGRPGWHIECSAMIEAIQSQFQGTHKFLVHAGGVDLKFPHHTNEIAQAEAYRQSGDWIPHWVHTGHLHIDGLKMSKSLKNFISIQDFFAEYENISQMSSEGAIATATSLESPADDFRLWCLGLSGSYRGPATFSRDRIVEARAIRQKLLRFLIDGEDRIHQLELRAQSGLAATTSISMSIEVKDADRRIWQKCDQCRQRAWGALENDMDGSKFVDELLCILELGNRYISEHKENVSVEALRNVLSTLRELLGLVGFTNRTTGAGIMKNDLGGDCATMNVVGGEAAAIDALVQFRSKIRHAALDDAKTNNTTVTMTHILKLCDEMRDSLLPQIGVELLDGKTTSKEEYLSDSWRFCLPRAVHVADESSSPGLSPTSMVLDTIPLEKYFSVGQYEGKFSSFTSDGIPTHNADGSMVSKRLLKKLIKKREAHKKRLSGL